MAVAVVSVVPVGTGSPSISDFVTRAVNIARESGLKYELTPMGTCLEGDLPTILDTVRQMHESGFGQGAVRVLTSITVDDRRDKDLTMNGKRSAVAEKLGWN
jgi:uncharacterized protein (TIGR00106 family)